MSIFFYQSWTPAGLQKLYNVKGLANNIDLRICGSGSKELLKVMPVSATLVQGNSESLQQSWHAYSLLVLALASLQANVNVQIQRRQHHPVLAAAAARI